jgi:hypothetical protein
MCPNKDLLLPLQHLSANDPVVARQMFLLLFSGLYRSIPSMYEDAKSLALRSDVRAHLTRVLGLSGTIPGAPSSPSFVFALHLVTCA